MYKKGKKTNTEGSNDVTKTGLGTDEASVGSGQDSGGAGAVCSLGPAVLSSVVGDSVVKTSILGGANFAKEGAQDDNVMQWSTAAVRGVGEWPPRMPFEPPASGKAIIRSPEQWIRLQAFLNMLVSQQPRPRIRLALHEVSIATQVSLQATKTRRPALGAMHACICSRVCTHTHTHTHTQTLTHTHTRARTLFLPPSSLKC